MSAQPNKIRIVGSPATWEQELPSNHGKCKISLFTMLYSGINKFFLVLTTNIKISRLDFSHFYAIKL